VRLDGGLSFDCRTGVHASGDPAAPACGAGKETGMLRRADLLLVIVLGLAGCATVQSVQMSEKLPSGGKAINVEIVSFSFRPNMIEVPAGSPFTLSAHNTSGVTHNITILSQSNEPLKQVDVPAGQTVTLEVTLPAPGRYVFYCNKFMHRTFGMEGTFVAK
jgi:plastocyanin